MKHFLSITSPQQNMSADFQSAFLFIKLFSLMEARSTKAGIVPHFTNLALLLYQLFKRKCKNLRIWLMIITTSSRGNTDASFTSISLPHQKRLGRKETLSFRGIRVKIRIPHSTITWKKMPKTLLYPWIVHHKQLLIKHF